MRTIWKQPIDITDRQHVSLPKGATFLSVQVQDKLAVVWAMVDTNATHVPYLVRVVGTGHPIEDDYVGAYLGTIQVGPLVFHVFTQEATT